MSSQTVSLTLTLASNDLPALMALAAKSGVSISASSAAGGKVKKAKKEKDPNAPKKEANDWINFTQRARKALLAAGHELKGFVGQQYCAVLKEKLPVKSITDSAGKSKDVPDYDSISDAEIVSRFKSWTPPEQSKAAAAKASSSTGSSPVEAPAAAAPAPAAEKPKRQWSDEAKVKAAEKRAATKAAKASGPPAAEAAAPATAWASPQKQSSSASNAAAAPASQSAETDDITEFEPVKIGGVSYLKNCRGDILNEEYDWVGRLKDGKINKLFPKPADLDE